MLIVLGELHKFKDFELSELKTYFSKIKFIKYDSIEPAEVINSIDKIKKNNRIDMILLNTKAKVPDEIINYLTNLNIEGIAYSSLTIFMQQYLNKFYISPTNKDIDFLCQIRPYSKIQYIQKRVIDYTLSITLLIITFPIMLYSIYRIKKESPDGGIFYKQTRVGINNSEFECIKFRSMKTNIKYFNKYTQQNDPRIFPWGKVMRKTRIDELPQLFNVLKGDMHLVGPRAEWNILVQEYEKEVPYYNLRHVVKPGITGWAQVKYHYGLSIEDTKEKLMYDLYYIKNWSIWLELKTILMTISTVVLNKGQ